MRRTGRRLHTSGPHAGAGRAHGEVRQLQLDGTKELGEAVSGRGGLGLAGGLRHRCKDPLLLGHAEHLPAAEQPLGEGGPRLVGGSGGLLRIVGRAFTDCGSRGTAVLWRRLTFKKKSTSSRSGGRKNWMRTRLRKRLTCKECASGTRGGIAGPQRPTGTPPQAR